MRLQRGGDDVAGEEVGRPRREEPRLLAPALTLLETMSRLWHVLLGVALIAGGMESVSPLVALAEDSPRTVRVSGRITDAKTGQPLYGATVALSL